MRKRIVPPKKGPQVWKLRPCSVKSFGFPRYFVAGGFRYSTTSSKNQTGGEFRNPPSLWHFGKGRGLGSCHSLYVPFRRFPFVRNLVGFIIRHVWAFESGQPSSFKPFQSTISLP